MTGRISARYENVVNAIDVAKENVSFLTFGKNETGADISISLTTKHFILRLERKCSVENVIECLGVRY